MLGIFFPWFAIGKKKKKNGYILAVSIRPFESICDQAAAMEPGTDDSRRM